VFAGHAGLSFANIHFSYLLPPSGTRILVNAGRRGKWMTGKLCDSGKWKIIVQK
jgi:hypothetical protein